MSDVDGDAFELSAGQLGEDGPSLTAASEVGGEALDREGEVVIEIVVGGVEQEFRYGGLVEGPVDVDVLRRAGLESEPQFEREPALEDPPVRGDRMDPCEQALEDDPLRRRERPIASVCCVFRRASSALRNATGDAYFMTPPLGSATGCVRATWRAERRSGAWRWSVHVRGHG